MSRSKRNYRIKTFEKLEALGISNEKEILNIYNYKESNRKLHRWIKKDTKGVALIENDGINTKLKHSNKADYNTYWLYLYSYSYFCTKL